MTFILSYLIIGYISAIFIGVILDERLTVGSFIFALSGFVLAPLYVMILSWLVLAILFGWSGTWIESAEKWARKYDHIVLWQKK